MKILRDLFWYIKQEKKSYVIGVSALFLLSLVNLIPARILGHLIDRIGSQSLTSTDLIYGIGVFIGIALLVYLLRYIWRIHIFGTAYRLENQLRNELFAHFTKMSPTFYHQYRVGDLMAHATHDLKSVRAVAGVGILQLCDSLFSGTATLLAMFLLIDVKLTLITIIPMPFLIIGSQVLSKKLHKSFNLAQEAFSEMNNRVLENINGIKVTKTFGQEAAEIKNFGRLVDDVYQKNLNVTRYDALFDPMVIMIIAASLILTFSFGTYYVIKEYISVGQFVTLINYIHQLTWPMMAIGFMYNNLKRGQVSYERITKLLNEPIDIQNQVEAFANIPQGDIDFQVKNFNYPDQIEEVHLTDVNFHLAAGSTLGLVGKTGSGKSTVIKLLLREYDVEQGLIQYGQKVIKDYDVNAYRQAYGYVPQDPFLFSLTILDNIRFGKMEASLAEVRQAAKIAAVDSDIIGFEQGYDTIIGERGVSLSGGQKQRIAMARAILLNPECLILDDALSAVDAKTEEQILANLKTLRQHKTTIIIAHRLSALQHAQEIVVLEHGMIKERGNHAALMAQNGWYAEIFRLQELASEVN